MSKKQNLEIENKKLEYLRYWIIGFTIWKILLQINNIFRQDHSKPDIGVQISHWVISVILIGLLIHSYKKDIKTVYILIFVVHMRILFGFCQAPLDNNQENPHQ